MGMIHVLVAPERSPDIPEADDIYACFLGAWDAEVSDRLPDGTWRKDRGEWHFGRVLEGRAIQDVWISPPLGERGGAGRDWNRYGTSIRAYDPGLGAWRVVWINPVSGARNDLVGRRDGDRIVQEGVAADGRRYRWIFSEIAAESFRWTGESESGGEWVVEAEFRARRRPQRAGER
jgi:hypothetical protein